MTLDDLEKVVREATPGPWECVNGYGEKTDFTERIFHVTAIDSGLDTVMCGFDYEIEASKQNFKYITTFNPQLLAVMIAELKSARKMVKSGRRIILRGQVIPDAPMQSYVLATEATDKILEGDT